MTSFSLRTAAPSAVARRKWPRRSPHRAVCCAKEDRPHGTQVVKSVPSGRDGTLEFKSEATKMTLLPLDDRFTHLGQAEPEPEVRYVSTEGSRRATRRSVTEGSPRAGFRSKETSSSANLEQPGKEEACCLAWVLSTKAHATVNRDQLLQLHSHIATCVDIMGAEVLVSEASAGIIRGSSDKTGQLSDADSMVRLGQLICRWAASHQVSIRVGVHAGDLSCVTIPLQVGGAHKTSYFGTACATAVHLATVAEKEWMVHLSVQTKQNLNAFRLVQLTISPVQGCYYLDATTKVKNYYDKRGVASKEDGPSADDNQENLGMLQAWTEDREKLNEQGRMSLEEFKEFLSMHGVNVALFGKGSAKSMEEFYEAVVVQRKSHLEVRGGVLERMVDLVRISLRIRDADNKLRELRIASQATAAGHMRRRDQKFAVTLKDLDRNKWQEAVEKCITDIFELTSKVQKSCFVTDMESYSYKEDKSASETIPGVMTTYRAHNIVINVKDKSKKDLQSIGLPRAEDFSRGQKNWTWAMVEDDKEEELMSLLQQHGIDTSDFPAQSFSELYDEVYERSLSTLEVQTSGELVRTVRIIKVWLHAQILNVDHILVVKAKFQKGAFDAMTKDQPISMRMSVDQDWAEAVHEALQSRLGLNSYFQDQFLSVDTSTHKLTEEIGYSRSYPGLKTMYVVNEVRVNVRDSEAGPCHLIGLPAGTDFSFSRREALSKGPETEDMVVTHWCWQHLEGYERRKSVTLRIIQQQPAMDDDAQDDGGAVCSKSSEATVLGGRVSRPKALRVELPKDDSPASVLASIMKARKTDWARARNAAKRIRDASYTCKEYHEDITQAFPELRLYYLSTDGLDQDIVSSGRTPDDEYQRTIGALFAVFWIMRLDLDGKDSFCYGLDDDWFPRNSETGCWEDGHHEPDEVQKRKAFSEKTDWKAITNLLMNAGLFTWNGTEKVHDEDRTLAMLVMMAIHDIMKLTPLLPMVGKGVKDFCGYKSGERVSDHDVALSYILVYHPDLLPSYAGLPKAQQDSVRFTHCKMEYNMGWLVQAEAPPGALFHTFRAVATSGKAKDADIAFYFVHWFVDLAGAEPSPLEGCEKFVLKFPQRVLGQFLESFSVVQEISTKSETVVLENYLKDCWTRHVPDLGSPPSGAGAVAKMRLVLMAQGDSLEILSQFSSLSLDDRAVLSQEMACTGCKGQQFAIDDLTGMSTRGKGPAILVYYGPALMQKPGKKDPAGALKVLAEVYRQARELWPLQASAVGETVTVRIDSLKEVDCAHVLRPDSGQSWVISKTSSKDAMVKLVSISQFKSLDWSNHQVMSFDGPRTGRSGLRRGRSGTPKASAGWMRRLSMAR